MEEHSPSMAQSSQLQDQYTKVCMRAHMCTCVYTEGGS